MNDLRFGFGPSESAAARVLLDLALREDLDGLGDITSAATIPIQARGTGRLVARAPGILAGLPVIAMLTEGFELGPLWQPLRSDGDPVAAGEVFATVSGSVRSILALERTALNFLQRLSGVASLTARFVEAVRGTSAVVLDTRKTTPGWRVLEKYAVRCGGGRNHRMGLYDAVLIKDNHLAWLEHRAGTDPITAAVAAARAHAPPGTVLEIEVETLEQLERALRCGPDIILLDNLGAEMVAEAVRMRDAIAPGVELEASGGVTLARAAELARTGVDRISVGALTHSAPALDIALDLDSPGS